MGEKRLDNTAIESLVATAESALAALSERQDPEAFKALLELSQYLGECLSASAQVLSSSMSWAQIGDIAGTSRQNAWSRWSS